MPQGGLEIRGQARHLLDLRTPLPQGLGCVSSPVWRRHQYMTAPVGKSEIPYTARPGCPVRAAYGDESTPLWSSLIARGWPAFRPARATCAERFQALESLPLWNSESRSVDLCRVAEWVSVTWNDPSGVVILVCVVTTCAQTSPRAACPGHPLWHRKPSPSSLSPSPSPRLIFLHSTCCYLTFAYRLPLITGNRSSIETASPPFKGGRHCMWK